MKLAKLSFLLALVGILVFGCENQEVTFDDFEYTAVYFPLQSPLRTLVLGDDRIDNSLDNELRFNVGVSIGGLYSNNQDWTVGVEFAPELAEGLRNEAGDTIIRLPQSYIRETSPSLPGQTTISAGEFNGLIGFQLEDSFLDDSLAWTGQYVIPLRIIDTNADSILVGAPNVASPDPRIKEDWLVDASPKDFTLFGIKYINQFHGSYLRRGAVVESDEQGQVINTSNYRANFVTQNEILNLETRGRNTVVTNGTAAEIGDGFGMTLTTNGNQVVVSPLPGAQFAVSGTGTFLEADNSPETWGGKTHNTFYLEYDYTDGTNFFSAKDTLVIRDRNVTFEEIEVVVAE